MKRMFSKRIFTLVLSLATLLSVFAISYAWFQTNKDVTAKHINIDVSDANNVIIAPYKEEPIVHSDWTANYMIYEVQNDFKAVSSDGINIYAPDYQTGTDDDTNGSSISYSQQVGYKALTSDQVNDYMYYQLFYLSTDKNIALYYTSESSVDPYDLNSNLNQSGFSSDSVAGAMRVIFQVLDNDLNVIGSTIWIPNVNYEIKLSNDEYIFDEEGTIEDYLYFINGTGMDDSLEVDTSLITNNAFNLSNGTRVIFGNITDNTLVCTLSAGISIIAIGFYLEGTDRECNSLVGEGRANLNLFFTSTH